MMSLSCQSLCHEILMSKTTGRLSWFRHYLPELQKRFCIYLHWFLSLLSLIPTKPS
uniref:Uncharacterized protein n=2 Tax=Musa acuminata subsp. malaccensis TaxID=214687 RepID=A0A804K289_MUSAM